ncbi:MAG: prepilin-type N-terminal cleavage/methylation domain-containing protein [Casimicrobiaceae bacterium]
MRPPYRKRARSIGMTLVEILIAIAITSIISLAGWRAIDVLQQARDQSQAEALTWQRLETLFESLESDLRRAEFAGFSGGPDGLRFWLVPVEATGRPLVVDWRFTPTTDGRRHVRRSAGTSSLDIVLGADAARLDFSADGRTWSPATDDYPLALKLTLRLPRQQGDIERLWVLR